MTDSARFECDLRFHCLARLVNRLRDGENCKRLGDGDEEGIISDEAAWADAPAVAEDVVARVRLRFVSCGREVAFRTKDHGLGVGGVVVSKVPKCFVQWICAIL